MLVYKITPENPDGEVSELADGVIIDTIQGEIAITIDNSEIPNIDIYIGDHVCSYELVDGYVSIIDICNESYCYTDYYYSCIETVLTKYIDDILSGNLVVLANILKFIRLSYDRYERSCLEIADHAKNFTLKHLKGSHNTGKINDSI